MRKSLDLDGDLDQVELILDLEEIFAIKFTDAELEACRTAGDLNDIVWRHLSGAAARESPLHERDGVLLLAPRPRIGGRRAQVRLTDRLDSFAITPNDLASLLQQQSGLKLSLPLGRLGRTGLF